MTSRRVFERFVPEAAVEYCDQLYTQLGFEFKIKRNRHTKLGDFRYEPRSGRATITINNDLNPYAFLITYLHEVAHHLTYKEFKGKVKPHGSEWKNCFKHLSRPVLNESVFPRVVLASLIRYFKNPKASSCSDPHLYKTLQQFDSNPHPILDSVPMDTWFQFKLKWYRKLEKKRTRWVCEEKQSGKKYLITGLAQVEIIGQD